MRTLGLRAKYRRRMDPAGAGRTASPRDDVVVYLSMEIGLESAIPTYAGGLGVLAGDTLRAAADLEIPMVAVSLAHRRGYFRQHLAPDGAQTESPDDWDPAARLEPAGRQVAVWVEGRQVRLRAWRYLVQGVGGYSIPVYLLDASVPENAPEDRTLTDYLYGGDVRYRLIQELLLGVGGLSMVRALGYRNVRAFHMNEGHSALLTLALLEEQGRFGERSVAAVRRHCVFTTHTPVPAGHDQFPLELVADVIGPRRTEMIRATRCCLDNALNMTYLALLFSRFINGVAMRHGQISRGMFPDYPIASITNGVHVATWASPPVQQLFDRHIPSWRTQTVNLRHAVSIPLHEIRAAHRAAKEVLLAEVERRTGVRLKPDVLTLGFARRATPYKRAELLVHDVQRLGRLATTGPLQIIYAGKAHPRDVAGKEMIRTIVIRAAAMRDQVPLVYLENYDMALAGLMSAGVDLWINTPHKPYEASGTSGMKAAVNGVPSLSVLDGWWIEGHVEGVTGWSVGETWDPEHDHAREAAELYDKLESVVMPLFYGSPEGFARVMRSAISINGSFFNAQRMVQQYAQSAYRLPPHR